MALILNIDTSGETANISIADNGHIIAEATNLIQRDHASFLHKGIASLLKQRNLPVAALDAVAVTSGPGSYTGIRIGMASAKGLSFALKKPFIAISTLSMMTKAATDKIQDDNAFYVPMVDARRMEVFAAVYDHALNIVKEPFAEILTPASFSEQLDQQPVIFFGSGMLKWKDISAHVNARFDHMQHCSSAQAVLSFERFTQNDFSDIVTTDPLYIKEFYAGI